MAHLEKFLAIYDRFLYLDIVWGKTSLAYPLMNSESWHAMFLNWAIRENIRPVELAQYKKIPYWAALLGTYFSILPS